jgi:hypothetical protein
VPDGTPKAAVGRTVHMLMNPAVNNGSDTAPAVITRVWSDTCVNVRVLADSRDVPWYTSVSLHPDRAAADAAVAPVREMHGAGAHLRAAWWPERV